MQLTSPNSFSQIQPYTKAPRVIPIAPAPENYLEVKKKYTYKHYTTGVITASIARRNARERNRVKQVNDGFNALRKRLPAAVIAALSGSARRGSGKKLSKVDTLRMVVEYIRYMEDLLDEGDAATEHNRESTSVSMETYQDLDDGFAGGLSPYSETVLSPAHSDSSSGVSSAYSSGNGSFVKACPINEEYSSAVDENELLDAFSWWQHK